MDIMISKLLHSAIYVALLGLCSGFLFSVIPQSFFDARRSRFKLFAFEQNGSFYNKYFKINAWKDKLPQFSELTKIGFSKSSLKNYSAEYLKTFEIETIRAEMTHDLLIILSPLFLLFSSKIYATLTIAATILGNIPFIMIQRYNRARIIRLMRHVNHEKTSV